MRALRDRQARREAADRRIHSMTNELTRHCESSKTCEICGNAAERVSTACGHTSHVCKPCLKDYPALTRLCSHCERERLEDSLGLEEFDRLQAGDLYRTEAGEKTPRMES